MWEPSTYTAQVLPHSRGLGRGGANLIKRIKWKLKLKLNSLSVLWFGDEKPVEVIIAVNVNNG